jgi:hypothetical protein
MTEEGESSSQILSKKTKEPKVPKTPKVPKDPKTPKIPKVPKVPKVPKTPKVQKVPKTPKVPQDPNETEDDAKKKNSARKSAKPMYNVAAFTTAGSVTPLVEAKKEPEDAIVMKLSVFPQNTTPDFSSDLFAFNDFGHNGSEWSPFESAARQEPAGEIVEATKKPDVPAQGIEIRKDYLFSFLYPSYI